MGGILMKELPENYYKTFKKNIMPTILNGTARYGTLFYSYAETFETLEYSLSTGQALELMKTKPVDTYSGKCKSVYMLNDMVLTAINIMSAVNDEFKTPELWLDFLKFYIKSYHELEKDKNSDIHKTKNQSPTSNCAGAHIYIDEDCEPISFFIKTLIDFENENGKLGDTDEQILKLILENQDIFLDYSWYFNEEFHSHLYLPYLQTFFPFTEKFIRENSNLFLFEQIIQNPIMEGNIELQRFAMKTIMAENLEEIGPYLTRGNWNRKIEIPDEMISNALLKYNL